MKTFDLISKKIFRFPEKTVTPLLMSVGAMSLTLSCQAPEQVTVGNSDIRVKDFKEVDNSNGNEGSDPSHTVCDPFGGSSGGGVFGNNRGLKAKLYYLSSSLPRYDRVADYVRNGTPLDANLYFSQLNVPTRPFDQGFMTQDGTVLKTPNGDTLYEWFALEFESRIKLASNNSEGRYQFALLSDDGSILELDDSRGFRKLVDNDGTHPTRLGCASSEIEMRRNQSYPIRIKYYQGPRFHIALMLLWRKLPDVCGDSNELFDNACGKSGNSTFFDSNVVPPRAQSTWLSMLDRGWRVVSPDNFFLPESSSPNPCPTPTPTPTVTVTPTPTPTPTVTVTPTPTPTPTVTVTPTPTPTPTVGVSQFNTFGFDAATANDTIFAIWQTPGVPSTSMVIYGFSPDQLIYSSNVDSTLVESHGIVITGLQSQTLYYMQSVSVAADGRVSYSQVISKTTK